MCGATANRSGPQTSCVGPAISAPRHGLAIIEALSMLDSGDKKLESLKKALIDAVIRDPDLDVIAIRDHLKEQDLGDAWPH